MCMRTEDHKATRKRSVYVTIDIAAAYDKVDRQKLFDACRRRINRIVFEKTNHLLPDPDFEPMQDDELDPAQAEINRWHAERDRALSCLCRVLAGCS